MVDEVEIGDSGASGAILGLLQPPSPGADREREREWERERCGEGGSGTENPE